MTAHSFTEFLTERLDEQHDYNQPLGGGHMGDPWMIRDQDAKRQILEIHAEDPDGECGICLRAVICSLGDVEMEAYPCGTLRALALSYSDHPDYRQEWRP